MSKSIQEIGVSIYRAKNGGEYYQGTYEYTFEPKYLHSTRTQISFLSIRESEALQVIESLQLKERETEKLVEWVSKQELKADSYRAKYIQSIKRMTRGMVLEHNS